MLLLTLFHAFLHDSPATLMPLIALSLRCFSSLVRSLTCWSNPPISLVDAAGCVSWRKKTTGGQEGKNGRRRLPTCREGVWRGRRGREEDIKVAAARCGVDASSEPICKALKMSCVVWPRRRSRKRPAVDVLNLRQRRDMRYL